MSNFETILRKYWQREGSSFDDLDTMSVGEIISRLPMKELLSCMTLCRTIKLQALDTWFIELHLRRSKPVILIEPVVHKFKTCVPPSKQLSLLDVTEGHAHLTHIPNEIIPFSKFKVMATCEGILCIKDSTKKVDPLWVLNPLTREHAMLPSSDSKRLYSSCIVSMGSDYVTGRHKILRLYRFERGHKENKFEILTVGDLSWRKLPINVEIEWYAMRMTFSKGVFYVQFVKKQNDEWFLCILALESAHESFTVVIFPKLFPSRPFIEMVEFDGILTFIEHDKWSMTLWELRGNKFEVLSIHEECTYHTGYRWSKLVFFETILKMNEHKYLLYRTTWKGEGDKFTEFDATHGSLYSDLPIPGLPPHFNVYTFKPSFLSPVVPLIHN